MTTRDYLFSGSTAFGLCPGVSPPDRFAPRIFPIHQPSFASRSPSILGSWRDFGDEIFYRRSHIDLPITIPTSLASSVFTALLGPRHLPVHCLLVSCICTLLVIYTDPAARFPISLSSPLEASTIRGRIWTRCMVPPSPLRFLFLLDAFPAGRATRDARHTTCPVHISDALTVALTALAFAAHE